MSDKTEGVPWPVAAIATAFFLLMLIVTFIQHDHSVDAAARKVVQRFSEIEAICRSPLTEAQKAAAVRSLMDEWRETR